MAKNWIKGAIKHPGALHRELGVPQGQKIPAAKLKAAANSKDPTLRKRAQLAETLAGMHSPARDVVAYNDYSTNEGKVPQVALKTGNPGTYTNPGTNSNPATVQQSGTDNTRAAGTTMQANNNTPGNGKSQWPGIQSYEDSNT